MDEEYCKMLEEYVNELVIALIVDMMKHGIFEDDSEDIRVKDKFVEEAKEIAESIEDGDLYDRVSRAVLSALAPYYSEEEMYEEEMTARANILLNYVGPQLESLLSSKTLK